MPLSSTFRNGVAHHGFFVQQACRLLHEVGCRGRHRRYWFSFWFVGRTLCRSISLRFNMPICAPGMPGISMVGMPPLPLSLSSRSISRSPSSPLRSMVRKRSLVSFDAFSPTSARQQRGSQRSAQPSLRTLFRFASRLMWIAASSKITDDLLDIAPNVTHFGEFGGFNLNERGLSSFAKRRAISVLPTPVGRPSRYSSATLLRASHPQAAVGANDCGAQWLRLFCFLLANDVTVQFGHDFAGVKLVIIFQITRWCWYKRRSRPRQLMDLRAIVPRIETIDIDKARAADKA